MKRLEFGRRGRLQPAHGIAAIAVIVLATAGALDSQQRSAPFSAGELAALPKANWLKNGGNLFNQNYTPLTQINRETVASVKGVWRTHLNGSGIAAKYSCEAQPVVHEGTIYIVTGADDVFALNVKTGDMVYYGKYSGTDVEVDGEKFVILRESDILGILE